MLQRIYRNRSASVALEITAAMTLMMASDLHAAAARGDKSVPKFEVVGTDPAGDWGPPEPLSEDSGQDLVEASLGMLKPKVVGFRVKLASLGNAPMRDQALYRWEFEIPDGDSLAKYRLVRCDLELLGGSMRSSCKDAASTNSMHFQLEKYEKGVDAAGYTSSTTWVPIGEILEATIDESEATVTVPVPLRMIDRKAGELIFNGREEGSSPFVTAHPWFFSMSGQIGDDDVHGPMDRLYLTKPFTIPSHRSKR